MDVMETGKRKREFVESVSKSMRDKNRNDKVRKILRETDRQTKRNKIDKDRDRVTRLKSRSKRNGTERGRGGGVIKILTLNLR